jgi:hypothetical protein
MRLQNTTNETQADSDSVLVPSNTTMVTSTVRPEPTRKLQNNVKIVVQNKMVRNVLNIYVNTGAWFLSQLATHPFKDEGKEELFILGIPNLYVISFGRMFGNTFMFSVH